MPTRKWASLVTGMVKNLPVMQETWIRTLGQEDPLKKEWQPTPVILPGVFHGKRNLVDYIQFMGLQRVGHDGVTNT